jgi:hypothetical protein
VRLSSDDGIRKPSGITGGSASKVDIDRNNPLEIKAIGVIISTFETLPSSDNQKGPRCDAGEYNEWGEANHKSGVKIA